MHRQPVGRFMPSCVFRQMFSCLECCTVELSAFSLMMYLTYKLLRPRLKRCDAFRCLSFAACRWMLHYYYFWRQNLLLNADFLNVGKPAKNRNLTPFPLLVDKLAFLFLFTVCDGWRHKHGTVESSRFYILTQMKMHRALKPTNLPLCSRTAPLCFRLYFQKIHLILHTQHWERRTDRQIHR